MSDNSTDSLDFEPTDGGQFDEGGEAEADVPFLDISQYADHYVTVKVDGEEISVPLSEAVAGYSRQADYTRKTQELASQKQELQWASAIRQALDNDPSGTIDLLAEHYGVTRKQAQAMVDDDPYLSDSSWDDPVDKRLREIDQRVKSFEQAQAQAKLEMEISRLQSKYGEEFDPQEVVSAALAQGNTNLEAVFKQIAFDRISSKRQISAKKNAEVTEAKKVASVVSGASSARSAKDDSGPIRSIADAYNAAKRHHGVS